MLSSIPSSINLKRDYDCESLYLKARSVSESSKDFIDNLISLLSKIERWAYQSSKRRMALESFLYDLLGLASKRDESFLYQSLHKPSFEGRYIGYNPFVKVFQALRNVGFIETKRGFHDRSGGDEGVATRIRGTAALLEYALRYGITPYNYGDHFRIILGNPNEIRDPVRLRASKSEDYWRPHRGKRLPVDLSDPRVQSLVYQMKGLNAFIARYTITGCIFEGFFRQFNQGEADNYAFNKGGRIYALGNYQNMRKRERPFIRINGEPVCEVDISASHLTVAYHLLGVPLPDVDDLYEGAGIDSRKVVKRFVTATLGSGAILRQWPPGSKIDYLKRDLGIDKKDKDYTKEELGRLQRDYPIKIVREAVLGHLPILRQWIDSDFTWADLQYQESLGIISAMEELAFKHGVPALPLHDSLIIPVSNLPITQRVMKQAFLEHVGISIRLTVKNN